MMNSSLHVIILAAGQGKRMQSALPKVLHQLGGKTFLERIIATVAPLAKKIHVVYGHNGEQILEQFSNAHINWVKQTEQLGTGHAVLQTLPFISPEDKVLILVGDAPLISCATLEKLITTTSDDALGIITVESSDPTGLGRILRESPGRVVGIVEEKDASPEEKLIKEINTGIFLVPGKYLIKWLPLLTNHNAQKEYYLTDIIAMAVQNDVPVNTIQASSQEEVQGINDRQQLAALERYYQRQCANQLCMQGVTLLDPTRFDLRGEIETGLDVTIDVNVILEGRIALGSNVRIGPNCFLRNVKVGNDVEIKANSVIEDTKIGNHCVIGPFARIRPGTQLAHGAHVGNFVEIKNAEIGASSKVNHLSYVGDATIGSEVNIGAGTITCNYNGVNKSRTIIGDGAFIGSNTELIAPVTIGKGATIGAGSTITRDAPAEALTLSRPKQQTIEGWQRPKKKVKEE